ncbi:Uncharacterised protein [Bordetella pertussis]|nr:Uncharacterised protein [Bordetella pertussis]CPJ83028.1 Uncharacterised protein [Bordetella pertussis]CPL04557.1 Uncharacterised protein [Bordetella pertussis]CRD88095.1 Uncharacterised protein [Bordetella pertussis]
MAPVTPGQASAQATAIAPTLAPWCCAIGLSASANSRLAASRGAMNSALRARQSPSGKAAARSALKAPDSRPDCMGL